MLNKIIIVGGSTGVGKTAYALELAKKINSEVISIDSVQCFKYFDIGSAKPSPSELSEIKHHMIDVYDPEIRVTAADYASDVETIIRDLIEQGKTPILCGGSNLYLKAILYGLADLPRGDPSIRLELEKVETSELYEKLKVLDIESYHKINQNDRVRIIRAVESAENGQLFSSQTKSHSFSNLKYEPVIHLLDLPREELYQKINMRSAKMVELGLIEETKNLKEKFGIVPPLNTIGYYQVVQYLNGEITKDDLVPAIAQATRRYAKQQVTFWRNEPAKRGWTINT